VTNVFDEDYYTSLTDQREGFGFFTGVVGRPREWSVTLRKEF
jgi:iron complex outermembrane receptor protein